MASDQQLIVWNEETKILFTTIARDELKSTWLHDQMYNLLSDRMTKGKWVILVIGGLAALINGLMILFNDETFRSIGGAICIALTALAGYMVKELSDLNLSSESESHRLIAGDHTSLYEEIEAMKASPTQTPQQFMMFVRLAQKSSRDKAANLNIYQRVRDEWTQHCRARGISDDDTFDQIKSLDGGISRWYEGIKQRDSLSEPVPPEKKSADSPSPRISPEKKSADSLSPRISPEKKSVDSPSPRISPILNISAPSNNLGAASAVFTSYSSVIDIPRQLVRVPTSERGYDPKKLTLELDRLQDILNKT